MKHSAFALLVVLPICIITGCQKNTSNQATSATKNNTSSSSATATTTTNDSTTNNKVDYAKQAVSIFYNACALNAGEEAKVNEFARSQKMLELTADQKKTFNFEPQAKTVWGVHTSNGGQYYLVTGDNFCSLKAHFADMATVMQEFTKMSEQSAKTNGLTATVLTDRDVNDKVLSHQKVYSMTKTGAPSQYVLTAQASDNPNIGAQAVLNFRTIPATAK